MKIVYRASTEQHGDIKSGVSWSKNSTFSQARCASALSYCLARTYENLTISTDT